MSDAAKIKIAEQLFKTGGDAITKGNYDYAIDCFLKCTKVLPEVLRFRQALRATERRKYQNNGKGAGMAALKMKPAQLKLKTARARKKWKEVIDAGEEALRYNPWDVSTLHEIGKACQELQMVETGTWIMETAAEVDDETADVYRLLARFYEQGQLFEKAIGALEVVCKLDPADGESASKARQLAASATIQRGKLEEGGTGIDTTAGAESAGNGRTTAAARD